MITQETLSHYLRELQGKRQYEPTFYEFVKVAARGNWVPGQRIPRLVQYRAHGFPVDLMECGWILTAYDVATIENVLSGDEAAEPRMMAAFAAMRKVLTREYGAATTAYKAATFHLRLMWVWLREAALQRAIRTKAPCGSEDIMLYRSVATTQGFDEDMGGMLLRLQMTLGGAPMVAWWGRLQDSDPLTTPLWPREAIRELHLSAPVLPPQLANLGGQPSGPHGGLIEAAHPPALDGGLSQPVDSSGQSVVHGSTLPVHTGGGSGTLLDQAPAPNAVGGGEEPAGADEGGSAKPEVPGVPATVRPLMQAAVPRRRVHGAVQAAAAQAPAVRGPGSPCLEVGGAIPMEVDTPDGGEAAAGPGAVKTGSLSPACLLPPADAERRQPLNTAPERLETRPLVRLAAAPAHDDPTGARLRGRVFGLEDLEGPSGSSFVKCVTVRLAEFADAKVTIDVSVLHFRELWVTEWFSSTPVQYGVVKAAVLAKGRVIAVPSFQMKGLATRDTSNDAEARSILQHLITWLKKAKALSARCILIPVPTGKHWALAVVYSPGAPHIPPNAT